jgi:hypothetical protein
MPSITAAQSITSITCPNCGKSGSLKSQLPPGARVRCKGCNRSFEPAIEIQRIDCSELNVGPCEEPTPPVPPTAPRLRGLFIPKSKSSPSRTPEAATGAEDDASPGESTPAQGGISASHLEAPLEAADKNTESVRAKAKPAVSSVINSAKELGARARDYAGSDEAKKLADEVLRKAKQASSSAKEHATDLTRRAIDAAVATMPFWKKLYSEILEIVGATARQTARLIGYGCGIARTRVLLRKARSAQLALGNRMYEAGVGDEVIRGQIASLDDRIASVELGKGSTKQMEAEKKGLMIRLAADALAQDVAPTGAAAEHGGAISARDAVEANRSHLESTRAGLAPQDTTSWRRIGLGYGVVLLALTFATTLFLPSANMPSDVPRPFMTDTIPTRFGDTGEHPKGVIQKDIPEGKSVTEAVTKLPLTDQTEVGNGRVESPDPTQPGLDGAEWSTTRCLICNGGRSAGAVAAYSDLKGYGLCDRCGQCYRGWCRVVDEMKAGVPPSPQDATLLEFKGIIERNFHQEDSDARRVLGLIFLAGKFGSEEWHVLTGAK